MSRSRLSRSTTSTEKLCILREVIRDLCTWFARVKLQVLQHSGAFSRVSGCVRFVQDPKHHWIGKERDPIWLLPVNRRKNSK
mmetsp:Transcript_9061/g.32166  ORF Transcript_9061/g.32166 Transcript_9061/m.32166 type:complete len:82 (+) Transcript_9061:244-489(+)